MMNNKSKQNKNDREVINILETKFIKTLIDFAAIDLNKEIKKWNIN